MSERLLTTSLRSVPWGYAVAHVMAAALAAVEPARATAAALRRDGDRLLVGAREYDLTAYDHVWLVGAGKAGAAMAQAAVTVLRDRLSGGIIVVKDDGAPLPALVGVDVVCAAHPTPDERSVHAGQQIATLLMQAGERDLVLALISGGGSALLNLPVADVSLADIQGLTHKLLACGASIGAINTLRKHLDQLKGGGFVRLAAPATVVALILSDVVGSPLDVIASGPTVADPTTFAEALALLDRYDLRADCPPAIIDYLSAGVRGERPETLKPDDPRLAVVQNVLIGSNTQAAEAALVAARAVGFNAMLLTTYLEGEARDVGQVLAAIAREIATYHRPLSRPALMIAGGETTVTIRGSGRGGRNQELALSAAIALEGLTDVAVVALATDGGDGPTDAAGAVATGDTVARARILGLDAVAHLRNNDAYPFFAALGDLLLPGPTGTNVNDLIFVVAG
ncbi:Hydroxypyruvate reductase [Chloroflexus aggregans DSM 9485]|uniref:Hydroxypyruvate reductase n=1 Tax=Chloroflexus aggregans (strain MD-66 / DSM 9485) TaxID=326427 RepID=B8G8V8_CHLAD|nr:Hydroxypyruvate reductase [Chloroflexus aggregans DSM 9485]